MRKKLKTSSGSRAHGGTVASIVRAVANARFCSTLAWTRPCHEDETEEFRALAESAGAEVVAEVEARRDRPDPKYFIGSGKVEEIATPRACDARRAHPR